MFLHSEKLASTALPLPLILVDAHITSFPVSKKNTKKTHSAAIPDITPRLTISHINTTHTHTHTHTRFPHTFSSYALFRKRKLTPPPPPHFLPPLSTPLLLDAETRDIDCPFVGESGVRETGDDILCSRSEPWRREERTHAYTPHAPALSVVGGRGKWVTATSGRTPPHHIHTITNQKKNNQIRHSEEEEEKLLFCKPLHTCFTIVTDPFTTPPPPTVHHT